MIYVEKTPIMENSMEFFKIFEIFFLSVEYLLAQLTNVQDVKLTYLRNMRRKEITL